MKVTTAAAPSSAGGCRGGDVDARRPRRSPLEQHPRHRRERLLRRRRRIEKAPAVEMIAACDVIGARHYRNCDKNERGGPVSPPLSLSTYPPDLTYLPYLSYLPYLRSIVTVCMTTGVTGRSPGLVVLVSPIFLIVSMPSVTSPKTVCLPFR